MDFGTGDLYVGKVMLQLLGSTNQVKKNQLDPKKTKGTVVVI